MEEHHSNLLPVLNWGDVSGDKGELVLPVGTVTMLLADVEGSTRRWEADEAGMAAATADLSVLVDELLAQHNGVRPLEQGEGDSFVAAFSRASEATAAALEIVRKSPLPLRIGIHAGEAKRTDDGTYVGPTLNRTGRLRDMAHGGQIVISQPAADLVAERLPSDATLRDLGLHRLRDLSRPERVFQLVHPDLRDDFPALRSLDAYRHNLPPQRTPFFGRREEIATIHDILESSRLVTLAGPGGSGKTRLALQIAVDLVDDHADGVFFADLAKITEPTDVGRVVALAVGSTDEASADVAAVIADKHLLLVLDNCEHVVETAAELTDALLERTPNVRVLATSREPLRIDGEHVFVVPTLDLPTERVDGIDGLTPFAAAELFLDRAGRARADFLPAAADAEVIAEVCRRLDGIPLAIELAAARIRVLSPSQILDGLHERFDLLTGGSRTAMPRQQTLAASVDWSHDLLTDIERAVLRRISVFASGCTLDAAADVCSADDVKRHQVLDVLTLLVDKSLVHVDLDGPAARYRLLETIRQYGLARLTEVGEVAVTKRRFIDHFVDHGERLAAEQWTLDGMDANAAFLSDRDSFEVALRWAIELDDADAIARLTTGVIHFVEGMWIGAALSWIATARPFADALEGRLLIEFLHACAPHLFWMGQQPDLEPACQRAIAHARQTSDDRLIAHALFAWAMLVRPGPVSETEALAEAADRASRAGDIRTALHARANEAQSMAVIDPAGFEELVEATTREIRALRAPTLVFDAGWRLQSACGAALPRAGLAITDHILACGIEDFADAHRHSLRDRAASLSWLGRVTEVEPLINEILPGFVAAGDANCIAICHMLRAQAAAAQGDIERAVADAAIATDGAMLTPFVSYFAAHAALLAAGNGDHREARRLLDWGDAPPPPMIGFPTMIAAAHAATAILEGDIAQAEEQIHGALAAEGPVGLTMTWGLEIVAHVASAMESYVEAARLLAASAAHTERTGVNYRFPIVDRMRDETRARAEAALGTEAFETAWAEGFAMSAVEAHGYARRGRGERKRPSTGWASLTPTEQQVVELLREGLSNKEIAARMFASVRTITTHLSHIYTKLGMSSRTEVVAAASKQ